MRKIGLLVVALAVGVLALFSPATAEAATNGHHATSFSMNVGGTYFTATVYYHVTGVGNSGVNDLTIDEVAYDTNPGALLDRITSYGDIHGDNTYPEPLMIFDTSGNNGQNDVPSADDIYSAHSYPGDLYMTSLTATYDEGTNLWFEVCVTGGVGNSGDHVCVKHPSA